MSAGSGASLYERRALKTLTIDRFNGTLSNYPNGDINSGLAFGTNTFGNNPFALYGSLTWCEQATQIDPTKSVITDLVMAGKERIENGILYVYAIGHTGRLYKIQVNNPATYNPDYDNPVLLTTLTINSPTFTRGGSMDFYGGTQKIYIGSDQGVTSINFDGSGEAFVGTMGSWTQNVPRPLKQFIGSLFVGNGTNIAQIDSSLTVITYTRLTPAFPDGTQVRDIDTSADGSYLEMVVSRLALSDITSPIQDTSQTASSESYIFKWNGTDDGYTAYDTFPSFSLTSNITFGPYQYTFGYDQFGMAVYDPTNKIITALQEQAPLPNAITSNGNLVSWMAPLYFVDHLELTQGYWGSMDYELGTGYWACFGQVAVSPETDIVQVPYQMLISNFGQGISSNGYVDNIYSSAKVYFSTLETSSAPTTAYRFFSWSPVSNPGGTPVPGAIYQTQNQIFSKKSIINEVRIYGQPWVAGNAFTIDLIGSAGTPIAGMSKTFTAGATAGDGVIVIGDDFAWYTPQGAPTYSLGLSITNVGTSNFVISKVEIDYTVGGK